MITCYITEPMPNAKSEEHSTLQKQDDLLPKTDIIAIKREKPSELR